MKRMILDEIREDLERQIEYHKRQEKRLIHGCPRSDWHNGSWKNLRRALNLLNGIGEKHDVELYI